ncbi:Trypsin [Prauserella marina]|uniref:Trypsin n=1 Tax=Prauserella marina TaxID=530584 RepID=A0A1G6WWA7_9PSEU|nr:serine protease [Prauserella marina]PWV73208.1 trypsin [Prauserella marina]SDD69295.1 Trypsin [Prauserella marina]
MRSVSTRARLAGVLAAVLTMLGITAGQAAGTQPFIVGGGDAGEPYPFVVSLQLASGEHFCGGALVSATWVVTAAHCVRGRVPDKVSARIGSNDRTTGGEQAKVAEIVTHPDYDPDGAGGDIALVRLASPAKAAPIALGSDAPVGTATRLLGWGQTCPERGCGESPARLRQLDTSIVDPAGCTGTFSAAVELCTGNPEGSKGACYGDSGGPQITKAGERWRLLGVSSRPGNDDSTCATSPSIYTSAFAYADWIDQYV